MIAPPVRTAYFRGGENVLDLFESHKYVSRRLLWCQWFCNMTGVEGKV